MKGFKSREEASAAGKKGAARAAEVKRKKRDFKSAAKLILTLCPEIKPETAASLKRMGVNIDDEILDVKTISMLSIAQQAMKGDVVSLDKLIEYSGEPSNEKQRTDRERLKFDKLRYQESKQSAGQAQNANAQIIALAELINKPVENTDIESIEDEKE